MKSPFRMGRTDYHIVCTMHRTSSAAQTRSFLQQFLKPFAMGMILPITLVALTNPQVCGEAVFFIISNVLRVTH